MYRNKQLCGGYLKTADYGGRLPGLISLLMEDGTVDFTLALKFALSKTIKSFEASSSLLSQIGSPASDSVPLYDGVMLYGTLNI